MTSSGGSDIDHPSIYEYWDVTSVVDLTWVTFYWNDNSHANGAICPHGLCNGNNTLNSSDLTLTCYDGDDWLDLFVDQANSSLVHDQGYIQSSSPMSFSAKGSNKLSFGSNTGETPLPVRILDFTAACVNNKVEIKWQTASEINIAYFSVEESFDLNEFVEVAKVKAANNSNSLLNYTINIPFPEVVPVYFRLKSFDLDGKSTIYNPVAFNCKAIEKLSIFPNPSQGTIAVKGLHSEGILKIYNNIGQLVFEKVIFPNESILLNKSFEGLYSYSIYHNGVLSFGNLIIKR